MSNCNNESDNGRVARHLIIINESPFHEGHVLLVPDIDFGLNQVSKHEINKIFHLWQILP